MIKDLKFHKNIRHCIFVLLALEEAAAHIEYLYQRGELVASNVETLLDPAQPVVEYVVA